ncbi:neurotransmitter:Na+ symporter, NSS family [Cyclobacterium xiamenense]|uniref:Neurotransmitter:Na+ symporter, NSS family n=1 Tax=Cyclobacterium xiamenense TaxID=1297121 RepID=A0A1H6ZT96_9BACT|nr:sodium-dependent transporter [Cyclobacterium xiamenense]SEJ55856.1 neurotransmitter:Na+ symporter, NSS family [Cyclobacterium xiamenense]
MRKLALLPGKFSNAGHILASVGAAVGIANLVLFPARVFHYGGLAFILVFVLFTFILGVPLMIGETALGKHSQRDAVAAYRGIGGRKWGFAGLFGLITCCFILSFYIVVAGWSLYYLYLYLFQYQEITAAVAAALATDAPSVAGVGGLFGKFVSSHYEVLLFSGIFMGATVAIVANTIKQGIEWVSTRFIPLLVLMMLGLILSVPFVAGERVNYANFYFDFPALFAMDSSGRIGIIEALGQSFFSLSLGACSMVTYGTHIDKNTHVVSNAHYIVHSDTLVALLAGLLIIPLFAASGQVGLNPSLVFINLVDTFYSFGEPWGRLIGIGFFALFNLAIVTSTISMLEPAVNYFSKGNDGRRKTYSLLIGTGIFLFSVPAILSFNPESPAFFTDFLGYGDKENGTITMGYFNFILDFFGTFCLLAGAFLLSAFIRGTWTLEKLFEEITVSGYSPGRSIKTLLKVTFLWVIPLLMLLLLGAESLKVLFKLGLID